MELVKLRTVHVAQWCEGEERRKVSDYLPSVRKINQSLKQMLRRSQLLSDQNLQ